MEIKEREYPEASGNVQSQEKRPTDWMWPGLSVREERITESERARRGGRQGGLSRRRERSLGRWSGEKGQGRALKCTVGTCDIEGSWRPALAFIR